MQPFLIIQMATLLAIANGVPIAAKRVLGNRFSFPLDGDAKFIDGQPLFGRSKTVRGIVFSIIATALAAFLMGLDWKLGVLIAGVSMAGDLFSSFIKRRLYLPPSSKATGLDQIPEALFPLLVCRMFLPLGYLDVAAIVAVFFIGDLVLSRIFYLLHIRDRPY